MGLSSYASNSIDAFEDASLKISTCPVYAKPVFSVQFLQRNIIVMSPRLYCWYWAASMSSLIPQHLWAMGHGVTRLAGQSMLSRSHCFSTCNTLHTALQELFKSRNQPKHWHNYLGNRHIFIYIWKANLCSEVFLLSVLIPLGIRTPPSDFMIW